MEFDTLPAFAQDTISAFRSAASTALQAAVSEFSANTAGVSIPGSNFDFAGLAGASLNTQDSLIQAGINNASASIPTSGTSSSFSTASTVDVNFEPAQDSSGGRVNLNIGGQTLGFTVGGANSFTGGSSPFADSGLTITPASGLSFDISAFVA